MSGCQIRMHDSFLFRRHLGDWQKVKRAIENDSSGQGIADFIFSDPDLQAAIAFSSLGFFQRLRELYQAKELSRKDLEKLESYAKRYATRPTPFGFFSGMGIGKFRDNARWNSQKITAKKILRLELPPSSDLPGRLKKNPTLWLRGNQCRYIKPLATKEAFTSETVRIELSSKLTKALAQPAQDLDLKTARRVFGAAAKESDLPTDELLAMLLTEGLLLDATPLRFSQIEDPTLEEIEATLPRHRSAQALTTFDNEAELDPREISKFMAAAAETFVLDDAAALSPLLSRVKKFLDENSSSAPYPLLALNWEKLPIMAQPQTPDLAREKEERLHRARLEIIAQKKTEWRLTKKELDELHSSGGGSAFTQAKPFSCLIEVIESKDHLKEATFILRGYAQGSATRFFGRFAGWDHRFHQLASDVHRLEATSQPNKIDCAVIFQPPSKAGPSISATQHAFATEINFSQHPSTSPAIDLHDIYLVLGGTGRIELYSKKHSKILNPFLLDTTSFGNESNLFYRIVCDIAQAEKPILLSWPDPGPGFHFFPRISAKTAIIQKASWRFHPLFQIESRKQLSELLAEQKLPDQVLFVKMDMRLPIQLSRDEDLDFILSELKEAGAVAFEEILENELESAFEMVAIASFENTAAKPAEANKLKLRGASAPVLFKDAEKIHAWAKSYLYFKIFADAADFDEILIKATAPLLKTKLDWFFIRYQESQAHLRLRIRVNATKRASLQAAIEKQLLQMKAAHLVDRFELCQFDPETERYGGFKGLECFAKISALDSIATLRILRNLRTEGIPKSMAWNHSFLAFKIDYWLKVLVPSRDERLRLLTDFIYSDSAKRIKKAERGALDIHSLDQKMADDYATLVPQKKTSAYCKKQISQLSKNDRERFIHSILHLCFNRIHFPLLPLEEQLTYRLALKRLHEEREA